MDACVIIPARYKSTRFPGKPLVSLLGKPMILWVAELSEKAVGKEHVYIATEDQRIADVVEAAGYKSIMTSSAAKTGTDRLAEAALQLQDYSILVNVQGDEPLVNPADIVKCIEEKRATPDIIINGYCPLSDDEDPHSVNIPKVITDERGRMIYMSRVAIPGFKDESCKPSTYYKQVCIYGFNHEELKSYGDFGRKSKIEHCEDIEILRFIELGVGIRMFETHPGSLAVDTPEDVFGVEQSLQAAIQK